MLLVERFLAPRSASFLLLPPLRAVGETGGSSPSASRGAAAARPPAPPDRSRRGSGRSCRGCPSLRKYRPRNRITRSADKGWESGRRPSGQTDQERGAAQRRRSGGGFQGGAHARRGG